MKTEAELMKTYVTIDFAKKLSTVKKRHPRAIKIEKQVGPFGHSWIVTVPEVNQNG